MVWPKSKMVMVLGCVSRLADLASMKKRFTTDASPMSLFKTLKATSRSMSSW